MLAFRLNLRNYKSTGVLIDELSFPVTEYDSRNDFVVKLFDEFVDNNSINSIKPLRKRDVFGNSFQKDTCLIIYNSTPLYIDGDHVSEFDAALIVKEILTRL